MRPHHPLAPFAAACLGIALYAIMDAVMKGLVLAIGAYVTLFWRMAAGAVITGGLYAASRPTLPTLRVVRIHAARSLVVAVMALAFFWGIGRVPLAEAVGLSFIAPLIALALAAIFLGEQVGRGSIGAGLLGIAGVGVILAGRLGAPDRAPDAAWGMAAILVSAVFYAVNLVMARHQAQHAEPREIVFFQNVLLLTIFAIGAPFLVDAVPAAAHWPAIVGSALLAVTSLLLMSWAYRRAEAQHLVSVEYTAFIWAALMGWLFFAEALTLFTVAGTALIVAGCALAARGAQRQGAGPAAPEAEGAV
jgi:S-adenosylmethionine uptake transporter